MTHYKLTYFPMRARGEIIRFVFAAAGVEYEDHRLQMGQWPELKPSKSSMNANRFCFFKDSIRLYDTRESQQSVSSLTWEIHAQYNHIQSPSQQVAATNAATVSSADCSVYSVPV